MLLGWPDTQTSALLGPMELVLKMGVLVSSGSLLGTSPSFSGLCLPWATHSVTLPSLLGFYFPTSLVLLVPHEMLS